MLTTMRNPFCLILCCLITLVAFQCLPVIGSDHTLLAEETAVTQEKKSPSFTVKGKNINITPVKQNSEGEKSEIKQGQTTTGDQPHLIIDSPKHDVGEVWEGEDIIHSFIIKNTGTAQLDIKNVKAG